jgi:Spy/CpxP family protein refolding chaperone
MYISRTAMAAAAVSTLATISLAPHMVRAAESTSNEMQSMVRQASGGSAINPGARTEHDPAAIYIQAGAKKEQVEEIRRLGHEYETRSAEQAREVIELLGEMRKMSMQPDLDEEKILATQDKINKLQNEMATEKAKLLITIRKVLTPEQRKDLVILIKKRNAAGHAPPPETVR